MPATDLNLTCVALAVLAGGEGSRMGYNKAEVRLRGRPVLEVLLEQSDWPGPTLLVTAPGRERPTASARFSRELVDPVPGQGPLRGLLTALENAPADTLVVTAVDMPLITRVHLEWLVRQLARLPQAAGLMTRRIGGEHPLQPFPSAFRRSALPIVAELLASDRRSLHALAARREVCVVDAPPEWEDAVWTNLNTPGDVRGL